MAAVEREIKGDITRGIHALLGLSWASRYRGAVTVKTNGASCAVTARDEQHQITLEQFGNGALIVTGLHASRGWMIISLDANNRAQGFVKPLAQPVESRMSNADLQRLVGDTGAVRREVGKVISLARNLAVVVKTAG